MTTRWYPGVIALAAWQAQRSPAGSKIVKGSTVLFPFSIEQKIGGQTQVQIAIDKIDIDAPVDDAAFKMPVKAAEKPKADEKPKTDEKPKDKPPARF